MRTLSAAQRAVARDRATGAALLLLKHANDVHYTQGDERWEGIADRLNARHGEYPAHGDCSSTVTWTVGYNGLHIPFGVRDVLNGEKWEAGWTGTLAEHGRRVQHMNRVISADLGFYGDGPDYEHVVQVVGRHEGKPVVFSHGSEAGPFLLPYDYRPDFSHFRRYILGDYTGR